MKVLTIGGATQDIFITHANPDMLHLHLERADRSFLILEEGSKVEVERLDYFSGGGATNAAVSFTRLGFDVTTFCKIGNDVQGDFILEDLKTEGVDTRYVIQSTPSQPQLPSRSQSSTGISFIIPSSTGERTILAYRGTNAYIAESDVPFNLIEQSDLIYVTSLSGASSLVLSSIVEFAREHKKFVALNPGASQLAAGASTLCDSLQFVDILILNSTESNILMNSLVQTNERLKKKIASTGLSCAIDSSCPPLLRNPIIYRDVCFSIWCFFEEVLSRGPSIVVVTDGADGVYIAHENVIYYHPAINVKIVNALGAGDAFGSCFTSCIARGMSIPEALVGGCINSSSVIGSMGAKTGLLAQKELEKRLKQQGISGVQKFSLS